MISSLFSIVVILLILSFLVIIHELGHFLTAKWARVKVEEFGLGYPPKIKTIFHHSGTDFSLNWIPFGGFVKLQGEDSEPADSHIKVKDEKQAPFYAKSATKRLLVILAGAAVNFIFGVLAFSLFFSYFGIPSGAIIARVAEDSPAAQAQIPAQVAIVGLKIQDRTYQIDSMSRVIELVYQHRGEQITVIASGACDQTTCLDERHEYLSYVRTAEQTPDNEGALGIEFERDYLKFFPLYQRPFRGAIYGLKQTLVLSREILLALSSLLRNLLTKGLLPKEVAGPIGIVHQASQSKMLNQGPWAILVFAGMLSINLAVMNVLPIPALDGGRAVLILLEKIIGRKRVSKYESYLNYGGMIFLLTLIVLVSIKDMWQLVVG